MGETNAPIVADSVTVLGPEVRGAVLVAASHGGVYAAYLAARAGVRGVLLNDAGVGRERAGVGGLAYLEGLGVAAAVLSHRSAPIGDGAASMAHGIVSEANAQAAALGVAAGQRASEAASLLRAALLASAAPAPQSESRQVQAGLVVVDSASLVQAGDAGRVVITGSHGALLGGRAATALKVDAFAALFNDADGTATSRLPVLDARGIAAAVVSVWSARIGDGASTLEDGVVSQVNECARRLGARPGMAARDWAALMQDAARGAT